MYSQELVPRSLSLGFTSGANSEDAPGNWGRDGVIYWRYSCKVGAAYWFGKAAQQGSAVAISALAEMQPFLALEHAKEILKESRSAHYNFGSNVEARKHAISGNSKPRAFSTPPGIGMRPLGTTLAASNLAVVR
jgi:hypothetical protein